LNADEEAGSLLVTTTSAGLLSPTLAGIVASSCVVESITSPVPASPSKVTELGVVKFVPIIVTSHSSEAAAGVTEMTVGVAA
jgi:hypothetical protein